MLILRPGILPLSILHNRDRKKNLYILDRNAVILIKKYLHNPQSSALLKAKIKELKDIDNENNCISAFFSTYESINPEKNGQNDIRQELQEEITAIQNFYEKAQTDRHFFKPEVIDTLSSCDMFTSLRRSMHFLCESSQLLYQPVSPLKYQNVCHEILEIAELCDIPRGHPVVLCTIACLYRNKYAQDLLKFKKKYDRSLAYNAAHDIEGILFIARVRAELCNSSSYRHAFLKTFDKALSKILKIFFDSGFQSSPLSNDKYNKEQDSYAIQFKIGKLPPEFFPEAGDQYEDLIKLLYSL